VNRMGRWRFLMFPAGRASITPMTLFDLVHLGSVQLAGAGWLVTRTLGLRHWLRGGPPAARWAMVLDRTACLLLALHMVAAWWGVHGGNWSAAWEHTARETTRVTGWNSGVGLLFNLVTLATWLALAGPIPKRPRRGQPPPGLAEAPAVASASASISTPGQTPAAGIRQGLLNSPRAWGELYRAAMWLMAAVVFPRPAVRWGAALALGLAALWLGGGGPGLGAGPAGAGRRRRREVNE